MKYKLKRWFRSFILLIWKSLDKTIPILMKIFTFLKVILLHTNADAGMKYKTAYVSTRQGNTNFPNMMNISWVCFYFYSIVRWNDFISSIVLSIFWERMYFVLTILLHLKEFFHHLKEFINLSHHVLQLNQILVEVPVPIITINLCWSASENV